MPVMAYIVNNAGLWRQTDNQRPWYGKALSLLPDCRNFSVIELGSGAGEFARLIEPRVKKITCVDLSAVYVKKLKQAGFEAVRTDFNQNLPFSSRIFSLAISLEVIEHIVEAELFLKEAGRILKPKGYFLLSTPNIAWWGYRLMALLGRPPKKEGYHFRFFTHRTLFRKLKEAGFRVEKTASFTTIPWLNRTLLYLKLKPVYPRVTFWPNLLAQDLVVLCRKK